MVKKETNRDVALKEISKSLAHLLDILESMEQDMLQNSQEDETNQDTVSKKKRRTVKSNNLFDTMSEKNLHKDDVEIDRKLHKKPPVPRKKNRRMMQECSMCGKNVSVSPSMINDPERFRCNSCSIKGRKN